MTETHHLSSCARTWYRRLGATGLLFLAACGSGPGDPPAPGSVQSDILGGALVPPNGGEFVAALFQDAEGEFGYICGGAFVAENIVLTAAHCSLSAVELEGQHQVVMGPIDPALVRVARRPASLAAVSAPDLLEVESVHVHPDFDPITRNNDIAVWKLVSASPGKTLEIGSVLKTKQVADSESIVRTFGYGSTSPGSSQTSDVLRRANVPAVPVAECRSLLYDALGGAAQPLLPDEIVTENMVCAGAVGKGSCVNDDGGPLKINQILLGITSWGLGCGEADRPYVYTMVGRFRQWINRCSGAGCDQLAETTTCIEGFTDCDADPDNGCETAGSDCGGCEGDCSCDVLSPNAPASGYAACGAGETCLPVFETPTTAPTAVCAAAGLGGIGTSCLVDGEPEPQACAAGLRCEFGQCLPLCDLGLDDCPDDIACVAYPFPTGVTVTGRELGVCFDGVLAQDDFSDPYSGWYDWQSVRPLAFAEHSDGEYTVYSASHNFTAWDSIGPSSGADMVVEVDAGISGTAVVLCRNYWFQIESSGRARIAIYNPDYNPCFYCQQGYPYYGYDCDDDCDNSSTSDLALTPWVATGSLGGSHISASCVGNSPVKLTLAINGEEVFEFEESVYDYTTGWAGIGATDYGFVTFDNYFVWEP